MRAVKIVTFDLSLTATGYARRGEVGVLEPPKGCLGVERLQWIRDNVLRLAAGSDVVLVEGYSYGSQAKAHPMGELGGVVRLALHEARQAFVVVPPTCRAKYATGKGNASKDEVLAEAIRRLAYAGHDHNEADALWMLMMAADHYGQSWRVSVPQGHKAALKPLMWPDISAP